MPRTRKSTANRPATTATPLDDASRLGQSSPTTPATDDGPLRVPSYRRHKPTGQGVVTLDGRDYYLGRYGSAKSRREYGRLLAEWLAGGGTLAQRHADDLAVVELIKAYNRHAKGYYRHADGSPTHEVANIRTAMRHLRQLYGDTLAAEFGPLKLQAVRQAMIDEGWARKTINGSVDRIKRMFKWGTARELVPSSVFHGLQSVAGLRAGRSAAKETEPVKPVPRDYIDAVLPHVSEQIAAMIRLQLLTGARPGEILAMRACDLDTTGRIWTYTPERHKTAYHGHQRTVYLGPQAQLVVKPFLPTDTQAYLFSPRASKEKHWAGRRAGRRTPMTPSQARRRRKQKPRRAPGDRYTLQSYNRSIARACQKAGVPTWHPHRLRHSAATELRKQFGIDVARVVLGHRSAAVTEVYAELDREKALQVMAEVG